MKIDRESWWIFNYLANSGNGFAWLKGGIFGGNTNSE